ncbi:unnamed protein product [Rotaria sordida]|nr:unnamed protein product [Rotaria sordida]
MRADGQQAIVNAQQLYGTGVVMTEWAAFLVLDNKWQFLSQLLLAKRVEGTTSNITFSLTLNTHPIWNDLPSVFTSKVSMSISELSSVSNEAQVVANAMGFERGGPGVIIKSDNGTAGRLVQIAHSAHHTTNNGIFNWANDNNITMMMVNAVRWAAKLI